MLTKQQSDALYGLIEEWKEIRDKPYLDILESQRIQDCIDDLLEVIESKLQAVVC